jgi:hypothetical protein
MSARNASSNVAARRARVHHLRGITYCAEHSLQLSYSVHFRANLNAVPEGARAEIRRMMDEIAEVVTTIAPANPFWSSLKDSLLQIDVAGWRVVYRVEPREREIRVVELAPIVN